MPVVYPINLFSVYEMIKTMLIFRDQIRMVNSQLNAWSTFVATLKAGYIITCLAKD